jgi:hypothetical protein
MEDGVNGGVVLESETQIVEKFLMNVGGGRVTGKIGG